MMKHFLFGVLFSVSFGIALAFMTPELSANGWFRATLFLMGLLAGAFWGTFFLMLGLVGSLVQRKLTFK